MHNKKTTLALKALLLSVALIVTAGSATAQDNDIKERQLTQ